MAETKRETGGHTESKNVKPASGNIGSDISKGSTDESGNVTGDRASTAKSKGPGGDYDKNSTRE